MVAKRIRPAFTPPSWHNSPTCQLSVIMISGIGTHCPRSFIRPFRYLSSLRGCSCTHCSIWLLPECACSSLLKAARRRWSIHGGLARPDHGARPVRIVVQSGGGHPIWDRLVLIRRHWPACSGIHSLGWRIGSSIRKGRRPMVWRRSLAAHAVHVRLTWMTWGTWSGAIASIIARPWISVWRGPHGHALRSHTISTVLHHLLAVTGHGL